MSAPPPDAEPAAHAPALHGPRAFSWDAVGCDPEGEGTLPLEALGGPAARILAKQVPHAERSGRGRDMYVICKRVVDIVVAALLLVAALPLLACVALAVKASSRGPVLFRHRRLGLGGREFECLKFRTMVADADEELRRNNFLRRQFEQTYKLRHDPRVTPVGAFLRRTSLDELPQLLHVLRGEMSLVGPRPIVRPELEKYSIYGEKLLTVKPGLSGLWQVCGRSDTTYPQRVMMDMHYIDHRSLSLDLRLMLLTVAAVVRKSGAC
ncbi:MAG TPA: sugar transferase [Pyrinomonadaceae bacterium]|nr:sugar transferase [Pyrinomonadaceae bacterium]